MKQNYVIIIIGTFLKTWFKRNKIQFEFSNQKKIYEYKKILGFNLDLKKLTIPTRNISQINTTEIFLKRRANEKDYPTDKTWQEGSKKKVC